MLFRSVSVEFEDNGYQSNPTLVILKESEAFDLDRRIRAEARFVIWDLGVRAQS